MCAREVDYRGGARGRQVGGSDYAEICNEISKSSGTLIYLEMHTIIVGSDRLTSLQKSRSNRSLN